MIEVGEHSSVRTILCYGDSNTWGMEPGTGARYARSDRWPAVLQQALGSGYAVIEEGLSGRTTIWDDPFTPDRNGRDYLRPCLESHQPLDLVIIMLGTNDVQVFMHRTAPEIARAAGILAALAQTWCPRVLLMAPPPVLELPANAESMEGAGAKSERFGDLYEQVAQELGCDFLDAGRVISSSRVDGVHFDVEAHHRLGAAAADVVREIFRY